jgi:PPM family protein phosphatase
MADATPGSPEVGTVLTMAYMTWSRLYVIHVGNCRCYLQRGATLEQITTDHTLAQLLVESGVLSAHESATSRLSSVLWNAIGGGIEDLRPEVYMARLQVGDILLLCTDGLSTHLPDSAINPLLQTQEPGRETCRKLVEAARSAGGTDNSIVIVARPLLPAQETGPAEKAAVAIEAPVATLSPTEPESQGVLAVSPASS